MQLVNEIRGALANLWSAKMRSFLAMLGVLIGAASVVALLYCGHIATEESIKPFKEMGVNLLLLSISPNAHGGSEAEVAIDYDGLQGLSNQIPGIKDTSPLAQLYLKSNFHGHDFDSQVVAAANSFKDIIKLTVAQGRNLTDFDKGSAHCVIGSEVAFKLRKFGGFNPVGQTLLLGEHGCTIVGVLQKSPRNWFVPFDINKAIFMDFSYAYTQYDNVSINNVLYGLKVGVNYKDVEDILNPKFKIMYSEYRTFIHSPEQIVESIKKQVKVLTMLLELIGYIALTVGGIGIMNVMLVTVAERHPEIGLRMAVGARPRDIQMMFIIEAVVLSLIGGIIGTIGGVVATGITCYVLHWEFSWQLTPLLLGFIVSCGIGVFFGIYPAYQASKLNPITCLRYN